jgi:acetyl esterase/lipase
MTAYFLRLMTSLLFFTVHSQLSAQPRQKPALLIPDTITVERDIVYVEAGDYPLTLDMAIPKGLSKPAPVVVHIHGGGFQNGQKNTRYALRYAKAGFIGVSINYRLSRVAPFPAAVHDCKAAIRWLRANAQKYHIDPDHIGVWGTSAGGNLAAILGTSAGDPYLEGYGGNREYSSEVQAVVDHHGPTDFLKLTRSSYRKQDGLLNSPESRYLGGLFTLIPDQVRRANPVTYVDKNDPPTLIFHGEEDYFVVINQSEMLYNALKTAGASAELVRVINGGHGYKPTPSGSVIRPSRKEMSALELKWFQKYLKHQ